MYVSVCFTQCMLLLRHPAGSVNRVQNAHLLLRLYKSRYSLSIPYHWQFLLCPTRGMGDQEVVETGSFLGIRGGKLLETSTFFYMWIPYIEQCEMYLREGRTAGDRLKSCKRLHTPERPACPPQVKRRLSAKEDLLNP
jgi:hypothetical protein